MYYYNSQHQEPSKTTTVNDGRIKIVIILKNLKLGGTERRMFLLASHLDRRKFDIRVAALMSSGELEDRLNQKSVPFDAFSFPETPTSLSLFPEFIRLIKWMKKVEPDVVLSSIYWAEIYGTLAAFISHVPVIISGRGSINEFSNRKRPSLVKKIRQFSNCF